MRNLRKLADKYRESEIHNNDPKQQRWESASVTVFNWYRCRYAAVYFSAWPYCVGSAPSAVRRFLLHVEVGQARALICRRRIMVACSRSILCRSLLRDTDWSSIKGPANRVRYRLAEESVGALRSLRNSHQPLLFKRHAILRNPCVTKPYKSS